MSIDKSGALHVSVVRTMKPCEDCGRSPALQYTLVGMTGVLCRECLNKVVADINQALAATSEQDVSEQDDNEQETPAPGYKVGDIVHIKDTPYHATVSAIYRNSDDSDTIDYALSMPTKAIQAGYNPFEFVSERLIEPAQDASN
jgi:hypothetical protein